MSSALNNSPRSFLPSNKGVKQYTWHRTPSQIIYEVAELPGYLNEETGTQIDYAGNSDYYPPHKRGVVYMFIGITCLAAMSFLSKFAYQQNELRPFEVSYARFVGMIIGNSIVSYCSGHTILEVGTGLEKSLLIRALTGTFSHICYCYALSLLDCSIAITLNITNYFLTPIISFIRRRTVPKLGIAVSVLSVIGISMLIYTGGTLTIIPLIGSLAMLISYMVVRQIKGEVFYLIPPTYLGVCGAILSSWGLLYQHAIGMFSFNSLSGRAIAYMVLISITGWASQIFQSWALQTEVSWRTSVLMYLIIIYGIIFDIIEDYKMEFTYFEIVGTLLLVGSNATYTILGY
eukprot:TRINITY_DN14803_c0_g1_i9.p1 TRINITY_DN14803_c0_g1~~TRINITY_DN14803_c0_g1_i9.p1  ORF type:complete len:346 (+),score=51.10 TRINITY_DN14803_c0_g1_i9:126-1163(+)